MTGRLCIEALVRKISGEISVGKWIMIIFFCKQKTAYEIYQCDWSSDVCSSDLFFSGTKLRLRFFKKLFLNGPSLGLLLPSTLFRRAKRNERIKRFGGCPSPILPMAQY